MNQRKSEWALHRIIQMQRKAIIGLGIAIVVLAGALTISIAKTNIVKAAQRNLSAGTTAYLMQTALKCEAESKAHIDEVVVVEQEDIEEVAEPAKPYTDEELDLLARLIYLEAGDLDDTAIYYTGSVLLNRVNDKRYPDTIRGCIYQKSQYSTAKYLYSKEPSDKCYEIAEELLTEGSVLPANVLGQAMFPQMDDVYAIIDGEYFSIWY